MAEQIDLVIGGQSFTGWETCSIQRSLSALCGSFEFTLSDEQDGQDWSFAVMKECVIKIGRNTVLTGFIDAVDLSIGPEEHTISIKGRDKTCDLVDCSVVADKKAKVFGSNILHSDVDAITRQLTVPFGINVKKLTDVGEKFKKFAIEHAETVFTAIDRACKQRGVICITNPEGNLQLTVSGDSHAIDVLKFGVNVVRAHAIYDYTNRFSHYRVMAQSSSEDDVKLWKNTAAINGLKIDQKVLDSRFRPTTIHAEAQATALSCKKRANSEALYRAANSEVFDLTVSGWRQSNGDLWILNQIVSIDIPPLYVKEDLLISEITYELSLEEGSKTTLSLMRKDAFNALRDIESEKLKQPKGTGLWGTPLTTKGNARLDASESDGNDF